MLYDRLANGTQYCKLHTWMAEGKRTWLDDDALLDAIRPYHTFKIENSGALIFQSNKKTNRCRSTVNSMLYQKLAEGTRYCKLYT